MTGHHDLSYLADLLLPLAGLSLLAPLLAATALPELALNLLSDTRTQTSIHFHYTAAAIPGLVMAAVLGAARVQRRWPGSAPTARHGRSFSSRSSSGVVLGPLPVWAHAPVRLEARDARPHRDRARSRRGAGPAGGSARRPRERDEHARRASLRATADLQFSRAPGGEVGRRRPDAAELPRRRARKAGFRPPMRHSGATRRWRLVRQEDGVLVFRRD